MKKSVKKVKKSLAAFILTGSIFLVVTLSFLSGLFDYLEYKTYDFRVNLLAGLERPSDDIVLVLLDQASIDWANQERGWVWPWPRAAYGELVNYMNIGGANSVAFDVIFSEASIYGNDDDESFIQASSSFGRVVQTVFFSTQSGKSAAWPKNLHSPLFEISGLEPLLRYYDLLGENAQDRRVGAQFPIAGLLNSAGAIGNITGQADKDGIFRRVSLFTIFDNQAVPGLPAASLLVSGTDKRISYDKRRQVLKWENYVIPVDENGKIILRFRGDLERYIPYTAAEILMSSESYHQGKAPLLPPEDFTGKFVFFGYYAPGLFDICSNPISSVYPGVGIHVTLLDNILQQDFIRESPFWVNLLIIFTVSLLTVLLVLFSNTIPLTIGGMVFILLGLTGSNIAAYHIGGYWTPLAAPLSCAFLAFLAAVLYNYTTEGRQKRFIKSAFSQYLSPTIIDQLLANPELLSLGGQRREISIFFSDIQGFTTISEKLDPSDLTELLNDYLSFMTDTILDSGGTIDKYEGDAIIAFWNAPVSYEDHAARALKASLSCQEKLAARQDFFNQKFGCRLLTRIGINTGYAVVGNMGSTKRFDYTMLGDSVNLAARLEGLNKQFGTYLMCTEATVKQVETTRPFFGRKIAQVAVVGKLEAVTVYEPMQEDVFLAKKDLIRHFDEARNLFYQGDFAAALHLFEALSEQDRVSFFYAEQCRHYREHPTDWKGHWQALIK